MAEHIELKAEASPRPRRGGVMDTPSPARQRQSGPFIFLGLVALAVILALGWAWAKHRRLAQAGAGSAGSGRAGYGSAPVPVIPGIVEQKDVPIYLDGLGTVQAFNTVTVRSRVDGQIQRIAFVEGQDVRTGDLLAQIDPAPFQTQLDQNIAKKAQDEAQLAIARITLSRDTQLLADKILAQQDYDTQKATVDQLDATVKGDQAAIDNTRIQLAYATITAPMDGRTGIRQVDQGNIVHATDSNGLVVITQLRPISVVFTLPEQNLIKIQQHLSTGETLSVFAVARDDRTVLGEGKLAAIDNLIDISTGTIRLKSTFPNDNLHLWPGQFVNVRLLLNTVTNGIVVPASVVQRGPNGTFAFVISNDLSAQVQPITVAQIDQGQALIDSGLTPGERVVVDGQYKLQAGAKVKLPDASPKSDARPASAPKQSPAPQQPGS